MAVTYVEAIPIVADNAYCDDGASFNPIVPSSSEQAGDLLYVIEAERDYPSVFTNSNSGGQVWTANPAREYNSPQILVARSFWARFNGAFTGGNPAFAPGAPGEFNSRVGVMLGFRPSSGGNLWAVDVAEVAAPYTAPGSPFDVTVPGQTALASSGVHIAIAIASGAPTFALQSGGSGWINPGGQGQWRSSANNDLSMAIAYKFFSAPGASGDCVFRQSAVGYPGLVAMITLKEISAAGHGSRIGSQRNHRVIA